MKTPLGGMVTVMLVMSLACSRPPAQPPGKPPSATPAAIVEVGGGKQVAPVGTALDQPVVIQVNDAHGAPVAGATVSFRSSHGAAFQPDFGVTGSDGQFTTAFRVGTLGGRYQVVAATAGAAGKPVELRLEELALGFQQNQGRVVSDFYCARCHDPESTPERVSNHDNLVAQAHAFSDGATLNKISDADLASIIAHGGPALGRSAEMPPYANTLNRAEIDAVIAYIRAIADPPYQPQEVIYAQR